MKIIFEKSIVSSREIKNNEKIQFEMLAFKKPGDGIQAKEYKKLIGKKLNKTVEKDYKFKWEDFE